MRPRTSPNVSCPERPSVLPGIPTDIVNTYGVNRLDFDIEGSVLSDTAATSRRDQALAALQAEDPAVQVDFTLGVGPGGLPTGNASEFALLQDAKNAKVKVSVVNIMTMDFYDGQPVLSDAEAAARSTASQLSALWGNYQAIRHLIDHIGHPLEVIKKLSRRAGALLVATVLALLGLTLSATPAAASSKVVYITFDDGPSIYTPQVLKVLAQYGVHATFFEVGQNIAAHPSLTSQVYRKGNSVQNHTWSHPDLRSLSASQFAYQVNATDRQIRQHTGYRPCCLRPPYGAVNATVRARANALGKKITLWTVDPRDWSRPGAAAIRSRVLSHVRPGSVVLLHDGGGDRSQTVAALSGILKTLKAQGYTFATWAR